MMRRSTKRSRSPSASRISTALENLLPSSIFSFCLGALSRESSPSITQALGEHHRAESQARLALEEEARKAALSLEALEKDIRFGILVSEMVHVEVMSRIDIMSCEDKARDEITVQRSTTTLQHAFISLAIRLTETRNKTEREWHEGLESLKTIAKNLSKPTLSVTPRPVARTRNVLIINPENDCDWGAAFQLAPPQESSTVVTHSLPTSTAGLPKRRQSIERLSTQYGLCLDTHPARSTMLHRGGKQLERKAARTATCKHLPPTVYQGVHKDGCRITARYIFHFTPVGECRAI